MSGDTLTIHTRKCTTCGAVSDDQGNWMKQ